MILILDVWQLSCWPFALISYLSWAMVDVLWLLLLPLLCVYAAKKGLEQPG